MATPAEEQAAMQGQLRDYENTLNEKPASTMDAIGTGFRGMLEAVAENTKAGKILINPWIETRNEKLANISGNIALSKARQEAADAQASRPTLMAELAARKSDAELKVKRNNALGQGDIDAQLAHNQQVKESGYSALIANHKATAALNMQNIISNNPSAAALTDLQKKNLMSLSSTNAEIDRQTAARLYMEAQQPGADKGALEYFARSHGITMSEIGGKTYVSHPDWGDLELNHQNAAKVFGGGAQAGATNAASLIKMYNQENLFTGRSDNEMINRYAPLTVKAGSANAEPELIHANYGESLKQFEAYKTQYTKTNPSALRVHYAAYGINEYLNGNLSLDQKSELASVLPGLVKQIGIAKDVKQNADGSINVVMPDNSELPLNKFYEKLKAQDSFANDYNKMLTAHGAQKQVNDAEMAVSRTIATVKKNDPTFSPETIATSPENLKNFNTLISQAYEAARLSPGDWTEKQRVFTQLLVDNNVKPKDIPNVFGSRPEAEKLAEATKTVEELRAKTPALAKAMAKGALVQTVKSGKEAPTLNINPFGSLDPNANSMTPAMGVSTPENTIVGAYGNHQNRLAKASEYKSLMAKAKADKDKQIQAKQTGMKQRESSANDFDKLMNGAN